MRVHGELGPMWEALLGAGIAGIEAAAYLTITALVAYLSLVAMIRVVGWAVRR